MKELLIPSRIHIRATLKPRATKRETKLVSAFFSFPDTDCGATVDQHRYFPVCEWLSFLFARYWNQAKAAVAAGELLPLTQLNALKWLLKELMPLLWLNLRYDVHKSKRFVRDHCSNHSPTISPLPSISFSLPYLFPLNPHPGQSCCQ